NAFEYVLVAVCRLHPCGDRTARVDADYRISHDAAGRARARLFIQLGRVQSYDEHLVQTRSLADNRCPGILWPGTHRRPTGLQILWLDYLARMVPLGENQHVGFLRPLV